MEHNEIKRIFGETTDHKAAEIAARGLPVAELEEIAALLAGDTDHGIEMGHLSPPVQDLLALLRRDDESWDDES